MRGKAFLPIGRPIGAGITPAYAGKRKPKPQKTQKKKDHPRICGEKDGEWRKEDWELGSPPHMRGKEGGEQMAIFRCGITPAYAGKRALARCSVTGAKGSPPHMRGKVSFGCSFASRRRITPAYAGKSL